MFKLETKLLLISKNQDFESRRHGLGGPGYPAVAAMLSPGQDPGVPRIKCLTHTLIRIYLLVIMIKSIHLNINRFQVKS